MKTKVSITWLEVLMLVCMVLAGVLFFNQATLLYGKVVKGWYQWEPTPGKDLISQVQRDQVSTQFSLQRKESQAAVYEEKLQKLDQVQLEEKLRGSSGDSIARLSRHLESLNRDILDSVNSLRDSIASFDKQLQHIQIQVEKSKKHWQAGIALMFFLPVFLLVGLILLFASWPQWHRAVIISLLGTAIVMLMWAYEIFEIQPVLLGGGTILVIILMISLFSLSNKKTPS